MIKKLIKNLRKDKDEGSLYYAWQSNIAMPIVDRIQQENIVMYCNNESMSYEDIRNFANRCAVDFLDILIMDNKKKDDRISTDEPELNQFDECCGECEPIELKQGGGYMIDECEKTDDDDECFNEYTNDCIDEYADSIAIRKEAIELAIAICANQKEIEPDKVHEDSVLDVAQKTYDFLISNRKDNKC